MKTKNSYFSKTLVILMAIMMVFTMMPSVAFADVGTGRIVFETPGKLPGIVRIDNIRHTHFSRNPKIAEYLKAYDYVKEFGEGVDRMCKELSAIGIKAPEYHIDAFIMKATVCARILDDIEKKTTFIGQEKGKKRARKGQENILALIEENPHISITAIAGKCGLSAKTVRNIINDLRNNNILIRIGPDRGGYWKII